MSSSPAVPAVAPATPPSEPVRLARHLRRTAGGFSLAFVRWNHPGQEDAAMPGVRAACELPIECVSVADVPLEGLISVCTAVAMRTSGNPLFVFGLHRHFPDFLHARNGEVPRVLTVLNLQRELFRRQIGCPLVFWLPEHALELIAQKAPDFWSWRSGVFDFDLPREIWMEAGNQLRLSDGVQLNLKGTEVTRTIAERLGVWQDLMASGAIPPRERQAAADVATDLFDLYTRTGDVTLADEWFDHAVKLLRQIQNDAEQSSLTFAVAAQREGLIWSRHPRGVRGDNLQKAIACFDAALRVYTEADSPQQWAGTQNNLGTAYQDLPAGDRGENLRNAIGCYQAALRVRTEANSPQQWATTQNNLGITYASLPTGNQGENLRNAIACFQAALRVRPEADFPQQWAGTQNNLGNAYQNLPAGDRGENLRNAIGCYQAALRVYTAADFPQQWATIQNNLGLAYWNLPTGDRGENLGNAIACFQAALRVRTEADFPQDWAETQFNRGVVLVDLAEATSTPLRLQTAREAFECAERGFQAVGVESGASQAREQIERVQGLLKTTASDEAQSEG